MKKMFAVILAASMLWGIPVVAAAPQVSSTDPMPAAWLDPIRVPDADAVMSVFRYDKTGRQYTLRRSSQQSTADAVCAVLKSLKAGEVVLNVPDISFIPVDRSPGDTVYELRTGDARTMRYYVDSSGFIISQRVEEGMMYQGMKFTGGNVASVISRLNSISDYENSGSLPFEMPVRLSAIDLFNYRDMTCTRILSRNLIGRVESLLEGAIDRRTASYPVTRDEYGPQFPDLHDMTLTLDDGTDLTVRLYEDGVQVLATDESLNVPRDKSYYLYGDVYDQLIRALRAHQSACSPAWLHSMDEHRITDMTLTSPNGGRSKTFRPGDREFGPLLNTVKGIAVEPLSMRERGRRSYLRDAYSIQIQLNDDTSYTVDYGPDTVEVEASGKDFVACYTLARGFRDQVLSLENLL